MKMIISKSAKEGFQKAFTFSPNKKKVDLSNYERKDYEAIKSDWVAVGRDIQYGIRKFRNSF